MPAKQRIVRQILEGGVQEETACLSAQVLCKFFVVVTRRITHPLSAVEAQGIISLFRRLPVAEIDGDLVDIGVDMHRRYGVSFRDGLIIAAARRLGCSRLLSEDLQAGMMINGLEIINPFATA
ncbi:MAG TPA: PIN domain-containing protein [Desulfobacteraceae bacterium]|nr:PIN domain-containing protein [Desulfobacteraceae bacterium]